MTNYKAHKEGRLITLHDHARVAYRQTPSGMLDLLCNIKIEMMKTNIFISWSGDLSKEIAFEMNEWLLSFFQTIKTFYSPENIDVGQRWSKELFENLDDMDFGILLLTRTNFSSPWILFEAGALSKKLESSKLCPILINLDKADLSGPLGSFQAINLNKNEILKLIKSINNTLEETVKLESGRLLKLFEILYPKFQDKIDYLIKFGKPNGTEEISLSNREILEENLKLNREIRSIVPNLFGGLNRDQIWSLLNSIDSFADKVKEEWSDPKVKKVLREIDVLNSELTKISKSDICEEYFKLIVEGTDKSKNMKK